MSRNKPPKGAVNNPKEKNADPLRCRKGSAFLEYQGNLQNFSKVTILPVLYLPCRYRCIHSPLEIMLPVRFSLPLQVVRQSLWTQRHKSDNTFFDMAVKDMVVQRFRTLCQERGIKPNELAALSGVTPSTVYSMMDERRRDVSIVTVKKLCDGLEITLGQFFSTPEFDGLEQEIL